MHPRIRKIIKWFFLIWGVLSFALFIVIIISTAYRFSGRFGTEPSGARVNQATDDDVRFVLNWCRLGEARTETVVQSYVSSRSFTGDHVDAYAIKVRNLTTADLPAPPNNFEGGWVRGDQLDPVTQEAVRLVAGFTHSTDLAWFPAEDQLTSSKYYIWVWRIVIHDSRPSSAQLIFARPEDSMIFYSSVKT